ncbi:phosphatase PAP2 family protein [Leifsonia sp. F6_8S_P_1B]|jgi:undecaprenyl-diphosphatase|uniref:Phosphatase PAP2 family protein n=1 Tax=Leifsonia williamsii TaxID=3035919 RepID=A0ABT8K6R9_9MICO|nr:phosphatase PAP2 family protein [Leifsonia williamsii]MDN4613140.1 phosphatase PAP2 family protein [Leifsonia williamsii]
MYPALLRTPRHWVAWTIVLFAATFLLGFAAKLVPALRLDGLAASVNAVNSPLLDRTALLLDQLDHVFVVGCILVVVFVVVLFVKGWRSAVAVCLVTGFGWITTLAVKAIVAEPRSTAALAHQIAVAPSTLSFPSGHVVFAVSLTAALAMVCRSAGSRGVVIAVGAILVLLVAWSRLYVGVHYGADVAGSFINGVAGAILFAGLWNLVAARVFVNRRRQVPISS